MHKLRIPIAAMLLALLVAACTTTNPEVSSQLEEQADRLTQIQDELNELSAAIEEMEASDMDEEHEASESSAFELAVAQYVMDTAGFHTIDDALAESGEIDPAYISTVTRVARVVAGTEWPDELSDDAGHLHEVLMDFEAALSEDDSEAATPLAGMAHDHQHDLSAAISAWLSGEMSMEHEHEEAEDAAEDEEHEGEHEEHDASSHDIPDEAAAMPNPFAGDEDSVAIGAEIYIANCATCHGDAGEGDGPTASSLEKLPADLHESHVQDLTDGALFHIITHGVADTPMPAWEDVLDEDARWFVVNFLRTFQ